ncbi:MAG: metallophosphoesterase family protein [Chitinivibrionales bacterium]|nr:metallophosphoesterase family protein [Chitinivibrionales bacterium]
MRWAFISDIHANSEALEAVVKDIDTQGIDQIACLGDVVGYGANPNECIDLVEKRCPIVILGNHDAAAIGQLSTQHFNIHAKIAIEWTAGALTEHARTFLGGLQLKSVQPPATLVHATPYEPNMWYYITSLEEAAFNFQFFDTQLCFVGHTHIPIIIVLEDNHEIYVHQDTTLEFSSMSKARFLINLGSVGQPRDHNPAACYGIYDADKCTFTYRRVHYDVGQTQAKMRKIKMPDFLINRLEEGK